MVSRVGAESLEGGPPLLRPSGHRGGHLAFGAIDRDAIETYGMQLGAYVGNAADAQQRVRATVVAGLEQRSEDVAQRRLATFGHAFVERAGPGAHVRRQQAHFAVEWWQPLLLDVAQ